jgi:hypothetical protein
MVSTPAVVMRVTQQDKSRGSREKDPKTLELNQVPQRYPSEFLVWR